MAAHLTKFFKIFDCGRFDNTHRVSGGVQRGGTEEGLERVLGLRVEGSMGSVLLAWALTSQMQIEAN